MSYNVAWSSPAKRAIGRLPEKVATAIVEYVYAVIADNPRQAGHPLQFELEGTFSARRADFRVVYEIHDDVSTVSILTIGHRSDIYRPR